MKLSISNIIWRKGKDNFESFLRYMVQNNIFSVELSLNSIFPEPLDMSNNDFIWLKGLLAKYNISVSSLHSLTYTRPDLELFNTSKKRESLLSYLCNYFDIARKLNTINLVYGSPKSRKIYNDENVDDIFLDFLTNIDSYTDGINFNIEPLPKIYCDYLNTYHETVNLINNSDFKNIFIQIDIRSIIENNEDIQDIFNNKQYIRHVHIGEVNLTMPSLQYADTHRLLNNMLKKIDYKGYLSIEVINHKEDKFEEYMKKTIEEVRKYYGK